MPCSTITKEDTREKSKPVSSSPRETTESWHEIDIIADQYGELVFVEVKARRNENYLPAVAAVDEEKRRNVREAAKHYMNLHRFDGPYRFDIITVVGEEKPYRFQHFVAAF